MQGILEGIRTVTTTRTICSRQSASLEFAVNNIVFLVVDVGGLDGMGSLAVDVVVVD